MSTKRAGIVAIIGRANTGKSSLFNMIVGKREAIVADEPGTTRDSIWARAEFNNKDFWLIDTAGMKPAEDEFELSIQDQIVSASESADVIVVVIEANTIISDEDRRVSKMALKSKKPVILAVNKSDKARTAVVDDFKRLGIKDCVLTSATQRTGLEELLTAISSYLPNSKIKQDPNLIKLGIIGRPNVGKSSLFNSLAKKQQAIVADKAGTTRDVNRLSVRYQGREIELMDTAGIRRSGKIQRGVEYFSVLRALSVIENSDICLLVIDSDDLSVHLDQKIAGMIKEAGKGLIIVISKWDSVEKTPYTRDQMAKQLAYEFDFVPWAPLIFTSSVSGQNVTKIFELALEVHNNRLTTFKTRDLNSWLSYVLGKHPPAGLKNRQPKLNYMVHEEGNPIPSFKIFGAHTKFLHWSYKRFLEREFRQKWPMSGTPIKFWFIEKH